MNKVISVTEENQVALLPQARSSKASVFSFNSEIHLKLFSNPFRYLYSYFFFMSIDFKKILNRIFYSLVKVL